MCTRISTTSWSLLSSLFYVLGGALFIAGSVYVVPGLSDDCVSPDCSIDVALWYLIGCVFYFFAAVIDLGLQLAELRRRRGTKFLRRHGMFRFDPFTESLIAGWVYLFGSILFLIGSVLFFPVLNAKIPARLTFRAGSCMYIFGSSYGIMQLVFPPGKGGDENHTVRRRTMTQVRVQSLFPNIHAVSDFGSDLASSFRASSFKMAMKTMGQRKYYCKCFSGTVLIGVIVKLMFICGSTSFLTGGILLSDSKVYEGGYLWLGGSFLFLIGSLVSITNLIYETKRRPQLQTSSPHISVASTESPVSSSLSAASSSSSDSQKLEVIL